VSRFIISGGGTGGHLSPAIALAEGLTARGHETLLLISRKEVDARLSEKYPKLRFERMPGTGFGWRPRVLLRCLASQARAFLFCLRLLRRMRPDGLVGFGGFTSAPLVLAGSISGVPSALHESNRVPGRAIRILGRLAGRVYLPPGIRIPAIAAAVTRHVGLPVRREITSLPKGEARAALGLDPGRRLLLILGGSQGASALNDWARRQLEIFAGEGIQVYCVTGLGKGHDGRIELRTKSGEPVHAVFATFSDQMGRLLSAADLVVSRAGAGTLAELVRCGTPAVLVPYPLAADDHQRANAEYFEREGGGLVVEQSRIETLGVRVRELISNDWLLARMGGNLRRMDRTNSLDLMMDDLEEIARQGEPDGRTHLLTA
jgi:UDP-N-acetylglucosamine--N-acetylmuramyl-(pentapeptide) pyrophosphoryl-undecaprenol N-acetylglucosamine transferase